MGNESSLGLVLSTIMGTEEERNLVDTVATYDVNLARAVMDRLTKKNVESLTSGLKLGKQDEQERITRKVVGHMLDNNESKESIYKYLTVILEIPEDTIDSIYKSEYNMRHPQSPQMDKVFTIADIQ